MNGRLGINPKAFVGLFVLIGGTLLWIVAFTGGLSTLFSSSTSTVRADFASVENIVPNDPVRIHGVQVGTVSSVTPDPGGRGATLTMDIDTSDPIYANASASILWRTALGANDAVALDPGTRSAGLLGGRTIPQSQNSNQVELDQITQAIHGGAQTGIQTMLQQLSPAFSQHPALARDLTTLAQIAPVAAVGIGAIRGQAPDTDLQNLVKNAGRAAQAITVGTGASTTRQFVASAASTTGATAAQSGALRAGIQQLIGVFKPIATVHFADLNIVLNKLDPLLPGLTANAPKIGPTLSQLHPAISNLHTLLSDATPLLRRLSPTVDSLAATAQVGVPVINQISPSFQRLHNTILPGLDQTTAETRGHPAYTLIGPTVVSLGTLASFFNHDGNMANLTAGLGEGQSNQTLPCQNDFSGTDFLVCQSLSTTLGELFTGGTSFLSSLVQNPGAAPAYRPLLAKAQKLQSQLSAVKQALFSKAPAVAKYIFEPKHGGVR
ncbi:MAG: MlaD family protein [Solirubrobacteraceae bacterium]